MRSSCSQAIMTEGYNDTKTGKTKQWKAQAKDKLIAALSAEGTSTIHNIEQIDRGYENIVERLKAIGAKIKRI